MLAIAIFTPEELENHAIMFAEMVGRATAYQGGEHVPIVPTWDGVIKVHEQIPHRREGAYKLAALRAYGWDVEAFHEIAAGFEATEERYCQQCEGPLDVAFGSELQAWRKCPTCGPRDAPLPR